MHPVIQMWLLVNAVTLISCKWFVENEENRMFLLISGAIICVLAAAGYAITHYS